MKKTNRPMFLGVNGEKCKLAYGDRECLHKADTLNEVLSIFNSLSGKDKEAVVTRCKNVEGITIKQTNKII